MSQKFEFWRRWLMVVAMCHMAFSLGMVVTPDLTRQFFSLLMYASPHNINAFGDAAVAYISLLHAVLGAVMMGWAGAIGLIAAGPLSRRSFESWLILVVSLTLWFVPDTLYSLGSGFWQNAAFNGLFMVLYAVPLLATYSTCRSQNTVNPPLAHSHSS